MKSRMTGARNVEQTLATYQLSQDEKINRSLVGKLAHFLDWCAAKLPYVPIAHGLAARAVFGLTRTPKITSVEVEMIVGAAGRVRIKLMADYHRGLVTAKALGIRATVDDDDLAATQLRSNVQRVVSATESTAKTRELIKTSNMRNDKNRRWVEQGVTPMLKDMNLDARLAKLLPPKTGG